MLKKQFSNAQIAFALRQAEAGATVCAGMGVAAIRTLKRLGARKTCRAHRKPLAAHACRSAWNWGLEDALKTRSTVTV
ncbi:hypothetical protein [Ruegeria atlantica]|uniref:hypothetical protein n=1 Tax=Ruegeria atlantica TaxID=81569 RepID=UPI001C2BBB99|nr:hypothetical protein [Ruegeria atlantica]